MMSSCWRSTIPHALYHADIVFSDTRRRLNCYGWLRRRISRKRAVFCYALSTLDPGDYNSCKIHPWSFCLACNARDKYMSLIRMILAFSLPLWSVELSVASVYSEIVSRLNQKFCNCLPDVAQVSVMSKQPTINWICSGKWIVCRIVPVNSHWIPDRDRVWCQKMHRSVRYTTENPQAVSGLSQPCMCSVSEAAETYSI